jgi:hypothetical protein
VAAHTGRIDVFRNPLALWHSIGSRELGCDGWKFAKAGLRKGSTALKLSENALGEEKAGSMKITNALTRLEWHNSRIHLLQLDWI